MWSSPVTGLVCLLSQRWLFVVVDVVDIVVIIIVAVFAVVVTVTVAVAVAVAVAVVSNYFLRCCRTIFTQY